MKRSLLLSDLADNDNDCGESVGSSFSYISQHACTDHHYEGISSTASNNEVASSDDSSSDDDGDSSHGGIDARSSSAKKRKWASGTIDDVIEIDSSSESESYSGESDDDDDEIGIIANSVDSGEESKQDNGLPLNDEENDDEYHSDSDSDLSDFPNDGAYAGGESDGDDEVSKAHGESDADAENLDAGEEASIVGNEYGNDSATDNINVEFADASNCDGSDSHKAADDDMMDVNQDEELVANDSGSESDDNSCDEDDNDGEIERFHVSKIKDSKLAMVTQGFRCQANVRRSSAADGDDNNNKDHATTTSENINTLFDPFLVKFRGKTFRKNHCYILKDGDVVTVGIKRFLTNDTAQCVLIVKFDDTILGIEDEGLEYKADYKVGQHVQVHNRIESISLSRFERAADDVTCIPRLIYQDQTPGEWYTFGYFYDRSELVMKRGKKRQDIRSLEVFAGAGGSMLGYKNNGFVTVMAVEDDSDAVATLKFNNSEINVYEGCIRKFMDDYKTLKCALGRIDHVSMYDFALIVSFD